MWSSYIAYESYDDLWTQRWKHFKEGSKETCVLKFKTLSRIMYALMRSDFLKKLEVENNQTRKITTLIKWHKSVTSSLWLELVDTIRYSWCLSPSFWAACYPRYKQSFFRSSSVILFKFIGIFRCSRRNKKRQMRFSKKMDEILWK